MTSTPNINIINPNLINFPVLLCSVANLVKNTRHKIPNSGKNAPGLYKKNCFIIIIHKLQEKYYSFVPEEELWRQRKR